MGIETLKLIVAISGFCSLNIFCNLLVGYSEVELCCSILHLDDNRSTSSDASLNLFEFYGLSTLISREKLEGTEVLVGERYLEWQAECCPGGACAHRAAIRCSLGCEWLISYEILIVVKYEIIRSKSFSRCSYLLIAILAYQLGEVASLVVCVVVIFQTRVLLILYKTFEICAIIEHVRTVSYLVYYKLVVDVNGCES